MTIPRPDGERSSKTDDAASPPEGWWKKILHLFLGSNEPGRDAISFAAGLAAAFLPPFGFHSLLVAFLAYLFRLSLPIGLLGTWFNNPWTFVPVFLPVYFAEIKVGGVLLNTTIKIPNLRVLSQMPKDQILGQVREVLYPFVIGSVLVASGVFLVSFPLVYGLIRWIKARKASSLK